MTLLDFENDEILKKIVLRQNVWQEIFNYYSKRTILQFTFVEFFLITNIFIMCHQVKLHRYIKGKICSPLENRKAIGKFGNILPEVLMTVHFFFYDFRVMVLGIILWHHVQVTVNPTAQNK